MPLGGSACRLRFQVFAAVTLLCAGSAGVSFANGQFPTFDSGFTQELWTVGDPYPDYFVGIAFDPDNGLWTTTSAPDHALRHWSTTPGQATHLSTNIHTLTGTVVVPGVTRILGLINHPNHSMYGITQQGIVELNETTGALIGGPFLPPGVPAGKIAITVDPVATGGVQNLVATFRRAAGGDDSRTAIYSFNPVTLAFTLMYTAPDADDVDGIAFEPSGQYFFYCCPFPTSTSSIKVLKRTGATLSFVQSVSTPGRGPDGLAFNNCWGFLMSNDANGTLTRYDFPSNNFTLAPTITNLASGGFRGDLLGVSPYDGNAYVSQWAVNAFAIGTRYDDGFTANNPSIVQIGSCFNSPGKLSASHVDVDCFGGSTGQIDLTVSGPGPYTYIWSPGGATTEDLNGIPAGAYTVTVYSGSALVGTMTVTISQPDAPLQASVGTTQPSCFGGATGSIDLSVSGGTPPYTYLWSPSGATVQDPTGLAPGMHSVTVTDAHGCTIGTSGFVGTLPELIASTTITDVLCNGGSNGSIDLTVSGGTPPYTYLWSPSGQTTEDRVGLAAGTYNVTVTDSKGCTIQKSATVGQPPALQASAVATPTDCSGGATGSIDLTLTGGTPPYTYAWSPNGETTEDLAGVIAGTYSVTVTDAHGCITGANATVTQPAALDASFSVTNVVCFGGATGAIDLTVTGGTAPYTYQWSPGGQTTPNLTGLVAGTYTVTVTDARSCITTQSATVTQPPALATSIVVTNEPCFGDAEGALDLTVSGGTPPYTYQWSPSGTTQDLSGLVAGAYSVTVTDSKGCTATNSATVTQPPQLVLSIAAVAVSTPGGSDGAVDLTVSGGTPPYTYAWTPGGAVTQNLSGLTAGTYSVTVTDSHGCPATASAVVSEVPLRIAGTDLLHDAFPFTDDETYLGTVHFDTTSALIKTGRNIALMSGNAQRLDIPGDTLVACSCGKDIRVDLVFRILPGPGNYHIVGNRSSGLRPVPTDEINVVVPGSANFWGQYLANNGAFGTPGGHATGVWDPNVWNSARMDTAEINLFPIKARGNLSQLDSCAWAGMYHEADPKYAPLGIAKTRCFLIDPAGPIDASNITCSSVPGWASGAGWDGSPTTKEFTKILPDGLFTPGTHIEYFIRRSKLSDPSQFVMVPDTTVAFPQPGEIQSANSGCSPVDGRANMDAHRWEQFGILPDRWKHSTYGGSGDACMLYVDLDDGFGDERTWVTAADLIGATSPAKWGAHNGWHVSNLTADPNLPVNFVRRHIGQAGTSWDMYQVRGVSDPIHGHAGSLGSRLSQATTPGSPAHRKEAHIGPTGAMLRTYYRTMFITAGRFASGLFGPFDDRSQDDLSMLMSFRSGSLGGNPRALWVEGASFAQAEDANTTAGYAQHNTTIGTLLGGNMDVPSYPASDPSACPDILTTAASHPSAPGARFGVDNTQLPANDVLLVAPGESSAISANFFQTPPGAQSIASTMIQPYGTTYWTGLLDAWDIQDIGTKNCPVGGTGGLTYFTDVLGLLLGPMCPMPTAAVGDPPLSTMQPSLALLANPVRLGSAHLILTLSRDDQVELTILDVAGRRVRTIWNGVHRAGSEEFAWDGLNEQGQMARSGMYFVRAKLGSERSAMTRTLVWLR